MKGEQKVSKVKDVCKSEAELIGHSRGLGFRQPCVPSQFVELHVKSRGAGPTVYHPELNDIRAYQQAFSSARKSLRMNVNEALTARLRMQAAMGNCIMQAPGHVLAIYSSSGRAGKKLR